jgi:hypothetical protein
MKAVLLDDCTEALFDATHEGLYDDSKKLPTRISKGKTRKLAEAVILQAIEDLWEPSQREESIEFFKGEGFETCASLAGMSHARKIMLIKMIADSVPKRRGDISLNEAVRIE